MICLRIEMIVPMDLAKGMKISPMRSRENSACFFEIFDNTERTPVASTTSQPIRSD